MLLAVVLTACAPVLCDSWAGPEALTKLGLKSELVIEGVHSVDGWKIDYVTAEYRAFLAFRDTDGPVTLHVLLPEGTVVFRSVICDVSPAEIALGTVPPWGRPVEPVGRSEVEWSFDGRTWTWERLDFKVTPDSRYMALVLDIRIPTVHLPRREVEEWCWNHVYVPKEYDCELSALYDRGALEWPAPAWPSGPGGFVLKAQGSVEARVEMFLWPGGVVTRPSSWPSWETYQVFLTKHLALVLPMAAVVPIAPVNETDLQRRVIETEWPEVEERFGHPYVPVVAVISVKGTAGSGDPLPPIPLVPSEPGYDTTPALLQALGQPLWPPY